MVNTGAKAPEPMWTCIARCKECSYELDRIGQVPADGKEQVIPYLESKSLVCPSRNNKQHQGLKFEWREEWVSGEVVTLLEATGKEAGSIRLVEPHPTQRGYWTVEALTPILDDDDSPGRSPGIVFKTGEKFFEDARSFKRPSGN